MARRSAAATTLLHIGAATALIEAITCALRFGLCLRATADTAFLAPVTGGWRIHHGYVGLVLLLVLRWMPASWRHWAWVGGWALVLSDALHHTLVLWLATGAPHFDLRYP